MLNKINYQSSVFFFKSSGCTTGCFPIRRQGSCHGDHLLPLFRITDSKYESAGMLVGVESVIIIECKQLKTTVTTKANSSP